MYFKFIVKPDPPEGEIDSRWRRDRLVVNQVFSDAAVNVKLLSVEQSHRLLPLDTPKDF